MAYTRNPRALFELPSDAKEQTQFLPPMNFINANSSGTQPVTYHNVILHGEFVPIVDIDWVEGILQIYRDAEDALNNIPSEVISDFRIQCAPQTTQQYLYEALSFLHRGHSLLHPLCTCQHHLSMHRCEELGITHDTLGVRPRYRHICPMLTSEKREVSGKELSAELGIEDISYALTSDGEPLLEILKKHCVVRVSGREREQIFFSYQDLLLGPLRYFPPFFFHIILLFCLHRNKDELLAKLKNEPLPFEVSFYPPNYYGMRDDIKELENKGLIYILKTQDQHMLLYYLNPQYQCHVDDDIKALWHASGGDYLEQAMTNSRRRAWME